MKKNNKGFSLVELIVVIAIMAILAAIAIPTFAHFINKANEASDDELLHNINYIFQAACLENGVDVSEVKNATITYSANSDMAMTSVVMLNGDTDLANKIKESFTLHFGEMKKEKFKSNEYKGITGLYFSAAAGKFDKNIVLSATSGSGNTYIYTPDPEQVSKLKNSVFMNEMGIGTTLGIMDKVSGFASGFGGESLGKVTSDPAFIETYCGYLGIPYDSSLTADQFYASLETTYGAEKATSMTSNAVILYATEQSNTLTTDSVKTLFGTSGAKDSILGTLDENPAEAMAQTAAAYSLYMAYLHTLDDTPENQERIDTATEDPTVVLSALDDPGFQSYINDSSDADIAGYLAAMEMLNDASGTTNSQGGTAAQDILNEGFKTPWMQDMLEQTAGN